MRLILMVLMLACVAVLPAVATTTAAHAAVPGPFVTFLFSRTEQAPAQNCVADPSPAVTLSGTVAPWMTQHGLTGFGTVNTIATKSTEQCTHSNATLTSAWWQLAALASNRGWKFGPHEYDSPAQLAGLDAQGLWNVTCGQKNTFVSHGLGPADGLIAYPGLQKGSTAVQDLQASDGQACFDWGRMNDPTGLTTTADATTAPFWQRTVALKGGPGQGSPAYTDPQAIISKINALQPGQWLTVQVYLLVGGNNPPGDAITWNCDTAPHASNDVERYCYSDFQQVALAAANAPGVTVTDPATVANVWGRQESGCAGPPC